MIGKEATAGCGLPPWESELRLVSLWDMLKRYAESFYMLGRLVRQIDMALEGPESAVMRAAESQKVRVFCKLFREEWLAGLDQRCSELNLDFCSDAVVRIREIVAKPDVTAKDMHEAIKDLDRRIFDQLRRRALLFVPPTRARHYDDFKKGWEGVIARFNVATDIEEAEKCFALGRYSACVFHLMRVAEIGVQELGKRLKLPAWKIQEPWGEIVKAVQGKSVRLPHKTSAQKKNQQAWSSVADALFQVNLAWRIPTEHPRVPGDIYTEEQAEEALGRVKALMRHLAATI